jgi:hypothetical protein
MQAILAVAPSALMILFAIVFGLGLDYGQPNVPRKVNSAEQ